MGALHDGHLSLARARQEQGRPRRRLHLREPDPVRPARGLQRYPRDEAGDLAKLAKAGVDLVFAPRPPRCILRASAPRSSVADLTEDLCGAARPNHFDGVATVVTKLLLQCAPDIAVFGEKDYQQLLVDQAARARPQYSGRDRRRARSCARRTDSRCRRATPISRPTERKIAPLLHQTISEVAADLAKGRGCDDAVVAARFKLDAAGFRVDYVAVRDPETLTPLSGPVKRARVLAAAYLGKTRLIDNVPVPPPSTNR